MSKKAKALGLPIVNERAAGFDIGLRIHVAIVPPKLSDDPVRAFQRLTAGIERMADWLVAVEPTGVYLIPVYGILEARGQVVVLVS